MACEPQGSRTWVPDLAERRLSAVESTLSVIAGWDAGSRRHDDDLPIEPRVVDEALDVGWHELRELLTDPQIPRELLDRLVDVCEEAVDLWWARDLPRRYERTVEALAFSILDLEEELFIPLDYDPEADDDDPKGTYTLPWWLTW